MAKEIDRVRAQSALAVIKQHPGMVLFVASPVIIGLGLTPPVRAAVLEWLKIGGVVIRTEPQPAVSPIPEPPPTSGPTVTVDDARRLVDFKVGVPTELGSPDYVWVSSDRRGRQRRDARPSPVARRPVGCGRT